MVNTNHSVLTKKHYLESIQSGLPMAWPKKTPGKKIPGVVIR